MKDRIPAPIENDSGANANDVNKIVRKTAIGSFVPDSASSVCLTLASTGRPLSREKTAAASVEPTSAPINSATGQEKSSSRYATMAMIPVVARTPTVASDRAAGRIFRKCVHFVCKPPSNRISTSAIVPKRRACSKSPKLMIPVTSDPATIPTTTNRINVGTFNRTANFVVMIAINSNVPATNKIVPSSIRPPLS